MVWVHDLPRVHECTPNASYLDPRRLTLESPRAVPLACVAGLGQGIEGYMRRTEVPSSPDMDTPFVLLEGAEQQARSNAALMSTDPSSAFEGFDPADMSALDISRAPVQRRKFPNGTVVREALRAPAMGNGERKEWSGEKTFEGSVIAVTTNRSSRRHQYRLEWEADMRDLILAGVDEIVDEGYIERYCIS